MTAPIDSGFLIGLEDDRCTDHRRVGQKAATLAELARAGFAVPEGVVLTVDAFDAAAGGGVPEAVDRALIRVADDFGTIPLAVRSSAPDEDQPEASHAGRYESVLGVVGAAALRSAVVRCWASARGGAAGTSMAVLIQRQLDPAAAGVAFTADPVTGDRDSVVIEAVAGLAAQALAGGVDPERWCVGRAEPPERRAASRPVLDVVTAARIADLARRVAAERGASQDIEWAIDAAGLWLLQARPITALPILVAVDVPDGYWDREPVHAPRPHTPMNRSLLNPRRTEALRAAFAKAGVLLDTIDFRDIGGWEYVRVVPLGGKDRRAPPGWLLAMLLRVVPALRRKVALARAQVDEDHPVTLARRWFDELRPRLAASIVRLRDTDLRAMSDDRLDRHLSSVLDFANEAIDLHFELHGTQAEPLYELATACREELGWTEAQACDLLCGLSTASTAPARRLADIARHIAADERLRALLYEHGPDGLERLAADVRVAGQLAAYRREDGFRALRYEVAEPTLGERDDVLLQLLRDQLAVDAAVGDEAVTERRRAARGRARTALASRPAAHRERFETALRRAETVYPVREDNEFLTIGVPLALARAICREYGRRLAERGLLADVDDVFFLEVDEMRAALVAGGDQRDLVTHRRGERAWVEAHPGPASYGTPPGPPPSLRWAPEPVRRINEAVLWYTDRDFEAERSSRRAEPGARRLTGIAGSPGRYTGPVRVIPGETEFDRIRVGDVVVCPVTSPVWSVVFPLMGALVTDAGGILSHPAIIAREYQLPAVVATGNATELLRDGQIVTVDGSAGVVELGIQTP